MTQGRPPPRQLVNLLMAVPYVLTMEAIPGPDGHWICHAEYPELPGVVGEAEGPYEALDHLDRTKRFFFESKVASGERIPTTRDPLPFLIDDAAMDEGARDGN